MLVFVLWKEKKTCYCLSALCTLVNIKNQNYYYCIIIFCCMFVPKKKKLLYVCLRHFNYLKFNVNTLVQKIKLEILLVVCMKSNEIEWYHIF